MTFLGIIVTIFFSFNSFLYADQPIDVDENDIPDVCEPTIPGYNPTDLDGDGINDECEEALAEKFKPVIHKDPRDLQTDLGRPEDLYTDNDGIIRAYLELKGGYNLVNGRIPLSGDEVFMQTYQAVNGDGETIVVDPCAIQDGVEWVIDIDDCYRLPLNVEHPGSDIDEKSIFYHVYRGSSTLEDGSNNPDGDQSNNIYVQYWFFFTMNDIGDDNETSFDRPVPGWVADMAGYPQEPDPFHEGDWEHVSIELDNYIPINVKFSEHYGYLTQHEYDCEWSTYHDRMLLNRNRGYSPEYTHLNVWVSRNSHALYNISTDIYHIDFDIDMVWMGQRLCKLYDAFEYLDATDYEFGYLFYYDELRKMGECRFEGLPPGHESIDNNPRHALIPDSGNSPVWLGFSGSWGKENFQAPPPKTPTRQRELNWKRFQYEYDSYYVPEETPEELALMEVGSHFAPILIPLITTGLIGVPIQILPPGWGLDGNIDITTHDWNRTAYDVAYDGEYDTHFENWKGLTKIKNNYQVPYYHNLSIIPGSTEPPKLQIDTGVSFVMDNIKDCIRHCGQTLSPTNTTRSNLHKT